MQALAFYSLFLAELDELPQAVAEGGFGDGWVAEGGQLGEGQAPGALPAAWAGLLQLRGQLVQSAALPEDLDGPALLQGCVYGLSTFAASQLTRRFTPLRRNFSAFVFISVMAAMGAPMAVSRSSMASLCLK